MRKMVAFLMLPVLLFLTGSLMVMNKAKSEGDDTPIHPNPPAMNIEMGSLKAKGSILMDQDTGKILYDRQAKKKMYPASTTKILTALIAMEKSDLAEVVTVGDEIKLVNKDSSKAGLRSGEKIEMQDLIRALMLPSGNDAACTIAVHIARKAKHNPDLEPKKAIKIFADMMNKRAKELGAKNSHFTNPHGYHDKSHYSTAYDLALMARKAMEYPFFRKVVKTSNYTAKDDAVAVHSWVNKNLLLDKKSKQYYYPYATGLKTGYTSSAGYCLVASASQKGVNLIAVVLGSTEEGRWEDTKALLDRGFSFYQARNKVSYDFRATKMSLRIA